MSKIGTAEASKYPNSERASTVLLMGCGWLGQALAKPLLASGRHVIGTTTTPDNMALLEAQGIEPQLFRLSPDFSAAQERKLVEMLKAADVLVLGIPPRSAAAGAYPALLRPVHRTIAAAGTRHVIFVSTTGVYPNEARVMHETDAVSTRDASSDILRAEGHFVPRYGQWKSTVVRLGGLIGPDRAPGHFLAGRENLLQGNAPTNLVHLADAVGVITNIIENNIWGHTFNVVAEEHPLRRDFYPAAARFLNLTPPTFAPETGPTGKTVDSSRVRAMVPYYFKHDNLLEALAAC